MTRRGLASAVLAILSALLFAVRGLSDRRIAAELNLSEAVVKCHLANADEEIGGSLESSPRARR